MRRTRRLSCSRVFGSRLTAIGLLGLATTGCSLTSPGCGNRDVRLSIEHDARESADLWLTTSQSAALPENTRIAVTGTYEIARTENTRSCSATIKIGSKQNAVEVPIEYEVIKADDGQVMYRWDKEAFGKAFIGSAMMSILSNALVPKEPPEAPSPKPTETPRRQTPPKRDVNADMERWRDDVRSAITSQAEYFAIEGSGSVAISFDVSATGEISGIKIVRGSGNPGLDATAVKMAEKAGSVRHPPNQQPIRITTKLSFL